MVKVLFVCYGNICRSPMAEFLFKDFVKKKGRESDFYIESAATSSEELGNPVYPPARRILNGLNIDCSAKRARKLNKDDYFKFDYIIGMDSMNVRDMRAIFGGDEKGKIYKIFDFDFSGGKHDVADPWYTGDFNKTYEDIMNGLKYFYDFLQNIDKTVE